MKLNTFLGFTLTVFFYVNAFAQSGSHFLTQEVFRSGQILNFQRDVDGIERFKASGESVNNVIFNIFYEHNDIYARFDFSLIPLVLFNQFQNQHFSYNITLGGFLNDEPLKWGEVDLYYGLGVDFDLSNFVIEDLNGDRVSFESGTIGLNVRVDLEIGEHLILKNSITRGWWSPDNASKWDLRSIVCLKLFNNFYLTATPNYISTTKESEEDNKLVKEQSTHFYITYGIGTVFHL